MCGIARIIRQPHNSLPDLAERLTAMVGAMAHRGPDDEGAVGWLGLQYRQRCTTTIRYTLQSTDFLPP